MLTFSKRIAEAVLHGISMFLATVVRGLAKAFEVNRQFWRSPFAVNKTSPSPSALRRGEAILIVAGLAFLLRS